MKLQEKHKLNYFYNLPGDMDIIYFHLQATKNIIAKQAVTEAVYLLAGKHRGEMLSAFLSYSFPCDT